MARSFEGTAESAQGAIAIVVSRFNESITTYLLNGALSTLDEHGGASELIGVAWVPGAWEIPLIAQRLAASNQYQAINCLGAVIRGETTHDQYINQQVSDSLGRLSLEFGIPMLFGVLTCQSLEQAIHRSGGRVGNKGSDCALAALEMMDLLTRLP